MAGAAIRKQQEPFGSCVLIRTFSILLIAATVGAALPPFVRTPVRGESEVPNSSEGGGLSEGSLEDVNAGAHELSQRGKENAEQFVPWRGQSARSQPEAPPFADGPRAHALAKRRGYLSYHRYGRRKARRPTRGVLDTALDFSLHRASRLSSGRPRSQPGESLGAGRYSRHPSPESA